MDLIADIGATNTRCSLIDDRGRLVAVERFENDGFDGVESVLQHYLSRRRAKDRPSQAAIGIAAPVSGDEIAMTNRAWRFSRAALADALALSRLVVVNDFAAVAWSLRQLGPDDVMPIGDGQPVERQPRVAIGPGSGLGVALLVAADDRWAVVAGEGGNATIAPVTPMEIAVVDRLRDHSGHCAIETLLSGPGLTRILDVLSEQQGLDPPGLSPAGVSAAAAQGEALAIQAQAVFFGLLGSVAGDIALTCGARGGVYIAGGIVPRLLKPFASSAFRARFIDKGAHRRYLERIPSYVITADLPALIGLRALLGYR